MNKYFQYTNKLNANQTSINWKITKEISFAKVYLANFAVSKSI